MKNIVGYSQNGGLGCFITQTLAPYVVSLFFEFFNSLNLDKGLLKIRRNAIFPLALILISALNSFGQTSQGTGNWSSTSSWVSGAVPSATSGSCASGSAASSTCNSPVLIGTNLIIDQAISISSGVYYVTGSPTDAAGGTAYTLTMSNNGSYSSTQNILDIKSGTTTFEGAASLQNANLYVRNGATLILGGLTLSSTGKSNVVIESGATLIVNGDVTDNDNGGTFTINGYLQINGNFSNTTGNVTVNASSGVFQTTGTMTTTGGSSTINGSSNDCTTGPCSAGAITCGLGGASFTSSVSPTSQVLCSGQAISPISFVTNATGTLAYQWQISTTGGGSGFTNISGATSANYTPSQPSITTWYRMTYTTTSCSGTTLISPSSEISLNNNPAPVAGSISGGGVTYCSGTNSTALTLSGYTATGIQWQSSSDNVTFTNISGATSSSYTAANVSSTTYYRVVVSNGSCNTVNSSSVSVMIVSASIAALLSGTATICSGNSTNLVVTITGGTSPFQIKYSDGTTTTTVNSYTSGSNISVSPTSTKLYSLVSVISANGNGCTGSGLSGTPTVNVNAASVAGSITGAATVCAGTNSTTLTLSGNTGTIQWQSSLDNSTWNNISGATSSTYAAINLTSTTYYRAVVTNSPCSSATSSSVFIPVNAASVAGSISGASTVCTGTNSTTLTLSGNTGTIQWQSSPDNSTWSDISGATSSSYIATNLTSTTYYRAVVTNSPCSSTSSSSATITVNAASVAGSISGASSVCTGTNSTTLALIGNNGTIQWQNSPDNSTWSNINGAISSSYIATNLTSTTYYRVVVTNSPCNSATTPSVTITVNVNAAISSVNGTSPLCIGITTTYTTSGLTLGGGVGAWSSDNASVATVDPSGVVAAVSAGSCNIIYTVSGGCGGTVSAQQSVTVNPTTSISSQSTAAQTQCVVGGSFSAITVSATGNNLSYQWYSNSTPSTLGGVVVTTGTGGTTSSYMPSSTSAGATYYYCVVGGSCGIVTSAVSGAFATGSVWNGSGTTWSSTSSWFGNCTPGIASDVVIPGSFSNYPTLPGNITLNSVSINPGGSLSLGTYNLTISGKLQNDGAFNAGTGTVTFSPGTGATAQITGSSKVTFYNLTVTNNTASTDLILQSTAGAALTNVLSVGTATFDVNGNPLTLISTETCGSTTSVPTTSDASIAAIGTGGAILGNVTVQRFMCREGTLQYYYQAWRDISSPVSNATVHDLQQSIPVTWANSTYSSVIDNSKSGNTYPVDYSVSSIQVFNESTNSFSDFLTSSSTDATTFQVGRGYSVYIYGKDSENPNGNDLWSVTGPINSGPKSLPVSFTSSTKGWNLVGNPFASTIDWSLIRGNSATGGFHSNTGGSYTNIQPTIYIENFSQGALTYSTYNSATGATTNGGSKYIATGQGFLVRTSATSPSLTLFETSKAAGKQTKFFKEASPSNILRIALASANQQDETVISLTEQATENFDEDYDAVKLLNKGYLNLSTLSPTQEKYVVNAIPFPDQQKKIPLDVSDMTSGIYSLSFTQFSSLPASLRLQLEDKYENTIINIRENSTYSFTVNKDNPSTYGSSRFNLILGGEEVEVHKRVKVYPVPVNGVLTVEAEGDEPATGEVLNMMGINVGTISFTSESNNQIATYDFSQENSGIYFIRVRRNDRVSVIRIVKD